MLKVKCTVLCLLLSLLAAGSAWAGLAEDWRAGKEAFNSGDYGEAIGKFSKCLTYEDLTPVQRGILHAWRGEAKGKIGDPAGAVEDYKKALEQEAPTAEEMAVWRGNLATSMAMLGMQKFMARDPDGAIVQYTKAIDSGHLGDKTLSKVYGDRGLAWAEKGEYERALRDLNQAMGLNPDNGIVLYNRAVTLLKMGEKQEGLAQLNAALDSGVLDAKRKAMAYNMRGLFWFKAGSYDKAAADYDRSMQADPDYAAAYNHAAWMKATCPQKAMRNGAEAVRLAQKALALNRIPSNLDTLAAAYAEAGKFDKAVETQKEALAMLRRQGGSRAVARYEKRLKLYQDQKPFRSN